MFTAGPSRSRASTRRCFRSYKVTLFDGRTIEASSEHLFPVRPLTSTSGVYSNLILQDVMDIGVQDDEGNYPWALPLSQPVEHLPRSLPVDAYLLGMVLKPGWMAKLSRRPTSLRTSSTI